MISLSYRELGEEPRALRRVHCGVILSVRPTAPIEAQMVVSALIPLLAGRNTLIFNPTSCAARDTDRYEGVNDRAYAYACVSLSSFGLV